MTTRRGAIPLRTRWPRTVSRAEFSAGDNPRVLLTSGSYRFNNVGDVAMCLVAARRLRAHLRSANVYVTAADQAAVTRHGLDATAVDNVPWRAWGSAVGNWQHELDPGSPRWWLPFRHPYVFASSTVRTGQFKTVPLLFDWIRFVESMDLVVLAGQGAIHDRSDRGVWRIASLTLLAKSLGVPVIAPGQGVGPLLDRRFREHAAIAMRHFDGLGLRDGSGSVETMRALGFGSDEYVVTGDDAIALALDQPTPVERETVGISLRLNTASGLGPEVGGAVSEAIERFDPDRSLALLPMMEGDGVSDTAALERIGGAGPRSVAEATPASILPAIARCRVVVTSAYHTAVFAQSMGVPVIALAATPYYRAKLGGVLSMFDNRGGEMLDPTDPDFPARLETSLRTWVRADVADDLRRRAREQATAGDEAFAMFLRNAGLL
ncbi:MAG: polysaccharide pyruvyl transferase family protein [Microthrixaceae bacterium]